eukprot:677454-Pyramimonas_sp.AAC.1
MGIERATKQAIESTVEQVVQQGVEQTIDHDEEVKMCLKQLEVTTPRHMSPEDVLARGAALIASLADVAAASSGSSVYYNWLHDY